MYLLVDNSDFEFTKLYIDLNNNWVQRDWVASCPLAVCIQEFLNEQNVSLKQLKGLGVVVGRGRFTATRVAVTVVNTLAYSLGLPVVTVSEIEKDNIIELITKTPVGQYASARYSGEAHIGTTKNKIRYDN
ncbi:MAG: hypothetical protein A2538_01015 [Candidatus Magasanikbacteria bacterium RIFOXYD2_FULL_41_14]|uniref:Gcp-like domain-containing protein n=1 Tax=Candidatus Magasanikbacteria bacterium RIFOXYD2_FULL_41_14 TaxID=1798709 RepID=A0A1F6PE94_9BACT|nr:MAG: hypothetical protein A2538_01015 [Candidatus Magasanikbacteria bacterium RIFOXYD2_FULL_41_14]